MNEVSLTTTSLADIRYPIFKLGLIKPEQQDGVVFYYHTKDLDDDVTTVTLAIIDDRTLAGDSLSLRRLELLKNGAPLYRVHNAIYFLGDLIKLATPTTWFIDSNGKVFNYLKTNRAILKVHQINKILPIKTGGAIIEVKGLLSRFKCLYLPEEGANYAGILYVGLSRILYGIYAEHCKDSWRRV